MSTLSQLSDAIHRTFEDPARGVVGLVDDLLRLCSEQTLELEWQGDRCRVRSLADGSEEVLVRPLRKHVFRAVLARLATLCNELSPDSVTPYGGQGQLLLPGDPPQAIKVAFVNTTEEQKLDLVAVPRA